MNKKSAALTGRIRTFFQQDLWDLEPAALSSLRRRTLKFLRVVALIFKGFKEDKCPIHASALTFISVMALVPFLVILFAIAKGVGLERGSEMLIEKTAEMPEAFQQAITNIITTVESASAGAMGGIGGVLFLWVAIKMLSSIEETFNLVWGVKTPRTLLDKTRNYIVIMVAAPILLIIANTGQPVIMGFASRLEWMGPFLTFSLQAIPVLTMALAFSIVYLFLPNTKVRFPAALTGALVAALLAILFQRAIIELGVGVSKYNTIYGALAAIPIFLFWVKMNWMILLFGAETAFAMQNAETYSREQLAIDPSARTRLAVAFVLMKKIAGAFANGTAPFDVSAYAAEHRIPIRLVNESVHTLSGNGLIAEASERSACFTLLREPDAITARHIADAVLDRGTDPEALGLTADLPVFSGATDEGFRIFENRTLKSF